MEVIEGLKAAEEDVIEKIKSFIMKRSGLYFKEHDMPSLRGKIAERIHPYYREWLLPINNRIKIKDNEK